MDNMERLSEFSRRVRDVAKEYNCEYIFACANDNLDISKSETFGSKEIHDFIISTYYRENK